MLLPITRKTEHTPAGLKYVLDKDVSIDPLRCKENYLEI
jgi:hypothetical protein